MVAIRRLNGGFQSAKDKIAANHEAAGQSQARTMQTLTKFPQAMGDHPEVAIVMSDDCRLSARIWRPLDAAKNPVPAILE